MSTQLLDKIRTERDQVRAAALKMVESDDFNPEDETYKDLETRAAALDTRASKLVGLLEEQASTDSVFNRIDAAAQRQEERAKVEETQSRDAGRSWGELFVRSSAFEGYHGRGNSERFELNLEEVETRALPTGLAELVAAGLTMPKFAVDTTAPVAPTPLLDNIPSFRVDTNAVEFVKWAKSAGGAAVVAEKADKPSAEYAPTVTSDTLDNIAVWTQITRQMAEDQRTVMDKINNELRRDVLREEEAQAAAALAAATLDTATGATLLGAIRVGMAEVQANGYAPNAVLLNPADYAELDLDVMGNTLGGPQVGRGFWGLTPIPSSAQTAGTAVVGDFRSGIERYIRSEVSLYITDSHASTFIANVLTILAERRSLTAVVRPQALVEASVTP